MTAETLTGLRAKSTLPPQGPGVGSQIVPIFGHYAIAANVEDGDIFELCWTPDSFLLLSGHLAASDLDTGTEALDMDLGWAANGDGSSTITTHWGQTFTNAAASADPDGLINAGVWTGDAITGLTAGGVYMPLVLHTPLWFAKKTKIQLEANAAAATFAAGNVTFFGMGLIIG